MLQALIAGQRDPKTLAELAHGSMRRKIPQLRQALTGHFDDHHAFICATMLRRIDALTADIAELDAKIETMIAPFAPAVEKLDEITGVGLRSAQEIIAEIGADMTVFPTAAHLVSWAKFSPIDAQSAGRKKGNTTGKGNPWLAGTVGEVVAGLARTNTFLGARYRRLARRRGKKRAIVAVGNSVLTIIWHLLSNPDARYHDLGPGFYESRIDMQRRRRDLIRQLEHLTARRSTSSPNPSYPPRPDDNKPRARLRHAPPGADTCLLTHRFSSQEFLYNEPPAISRGFVRTGATLVADVPRATVSACARVLATLCRIGRAVLRRTGHGIPVPILQLGAIDQFRQYRRLVRLRVELGGVVYLVRELAGQGDRVADFEQQVVLGGTDLFALLAIRILIPRVRVDRAGARRDDRIRAVVRRPEDPRLGAGHGGFQVFVGGDGLLGVREDLVARVVDAARGHLVGRVRRRGSESLRHSLPAPAPGIPRRIAVGDPRVTGDGRPH
jgi:hypothetical protein